MKLVLSAFAFTICLLGQAPVVRNITVANAASTGTTVSTLTKLTGAPSTAVIAATTDTTGMVGITSAGAGTTGNATITTSGSVSCVFDGATTAGHYATISSTTAGNCHDTATLPSSGPLIRVLSTNGSGGTYTVDLISPDISVGGGGPSTSCAGTSTATLYICTVNITSANILGWFATAPTTLISAPGSGKAIMPILVSINFSYGGTLYSGGGNVAVGWNQNAGGTSGFTYGYGSGSLLLGTYSAGTLFTQVGCSANNASGICQSGANQSSTIANQVFNITNQTASFTTGNGTAVATIYYYVVSAS